MISDYLARIEVALRGNPRPYFPMNRERRRNQNLKLGRELGYGLGMFEDWETWAGTTYGRIVVRNSLDTTGVVLDNKEWIAAIRKGVELYHEQQEPDQ